MQNNIIQVGNEKENKGVTCALCDTPVLIPGAFYCSKHQNHQSTVNTISKKGEMVMKNVKEKAGKATKVAKEKAKEALNKAKEKGFKQAVKESSTSLWSLIKRAAKKLKDFFVSQGDTIAFASGSVLVAGAVTASTVSAVAVGAGISLAALAVSYLLAKKKKKKPSVKQLVVAATTSLVTVAIFPFVLLGLSYLGIFVTAFGFVLPYSIIVA